MAVDIIIIAVLLVCAVFGYASGALGQVFGVASLVIAYLLSGPIGSIVARILVRRGRPPSVAAVMGAVLAGLVVFTVAKILFWFINARLGREGGQVKSWNRKWGALLGALKAFVVVWLLVCLVAAASGLQYRLPWDLPGLVNQSKIASWMADTYNPVAEMRVITTMRKLREISKNPEALKHLTQNTQVADFIEKLQEAVVKRYQEDKLPEGVEEGDPAAVIAAARLRDFLNDGKVLDALLKIDIEMAVEKAYESIPRKE